MDAANAEGRVRRRRRCSLRDRDIFVLVFRRHGGKRPSLYIDHHDRPARHVCPTRRQLFRMWNYTPFLFIIQYYRFISTRYPANICYHRKPSIASHDHWNWAASGHCAGRNYTRVRLTFTAALAIHNRCPGRGIETLLLAGLEPEQLSHRVALSLLLGFICMLVVEQLAGGHSHSHGASELPMHAPSSIEFDAELDELEAEQSGAQNRSNASSSAKSKAFPMTLGLVIHSIADGLALGVSFFSGHNEDANTSALSLVVFLAIIVHKGTSNHLVERMALKRSQLLPP